MRRRAALAVNVFALYAAMLSAHERKQIRILLEDLTTKALFALADTVSNKVVQVTDREDAISAILCYSESSEQLLKRKKVKKLHLLRYLHTIGQPTTPNGEKQDLVLKIIDLWSQPCTDLSCCVAAECSEQQQRDSNGASDNGGASAPSSSSTAAADGAPTPVELTLARQFITWYMSKLQAATLVANDVYGDCVLRLCCCAAAPGSSPAAEHVETFHGAPVVAQRLNHLTAAESLLFSVSELSTVEVVSDDHGLVVVTFAGAVHQRPECRWQQQQQHALVGVFEQRCGLAKHPATGSYVIKFVDLKIRTRLPADDGKAMAAIASSSQGTSLTGCEVAATTASWQS